MPVLTTASNTAIFCALALLLSVISFLAGRWCRARGYDRAHDMLSVLSMLLAAASVLVSVYTWALVLPS